MPEPVRRLEVFTGAGRRRPWSSEEKAAIVAASYSEGETVCAVARRHGLTPQQLFTWRRLARRAAPVAAEALAFVPAVVAAVPAAAPARAAATSPRRARRQSKASGTGTGIELEIGGVKVRVGADATPRAIAAVIRALKAGS